MIGPAVIVAAAIEARPSSKTVVIFTASVLVLLATWTFALTQSWLNSDTLFERNLQLNPSSLAAHRVLAFRASRAGNRESAIRHYQAALRTDPRDGFSLLNLANIVRNNDPARSIELYKAANETSFFDNPRLHTNWGVACAELGETGEAVTQFREAHRLSPQSVELATNLAIALLNIGDRDEAVRLLTDALNRDPSYGPARRAMTRAATTQSTATRPATTQ